MKCFKSMKYLKNTPNLTIVMQTEINRESIPAVVNLTEKERVSQNLTRKATPIAAQIMHQS